MASLINLPRELFDAIIQPLQHEDLRQLTLTSHRLRQLVEPRLYNYVLWSLHKPPCSSNPFLFLFMRSVLNRPELAKHVQFFVMRDVGTCKFESKSQYLLHPSDTLTIWSLLRRLKLPLPANGDACDFETAIALILAHLSSLRLLVFEVPESSQHTSYVAALGAVLRQSVLPPPSSTSPPFTRFQDLRSAVITLPTWERDTSKTQHHHLTDILAIFYLPSLDSLNFTFQSPPDDRLPRWPLPHPPCAANLATLQLYCTRTPSTFLAHLLSCTPALRTLKIATTLPLFTPHRRRQYDASSCSPADDDDGTRFHGGILAAALARHCAAELRSLVVSVQTTEPPLYHAEPVLPARTVMATPLLLLDSNNKSSSCDISRKEGGGRSRCGTADDGENEAAGLAAMRGLRVLRVAMPVLLGWWPDAAARGGLARTLPAGLRELWLMEEMGWWEEYAWDAVHVVRGVEALLESEGASKLVKIVVVMCGAKGGPGWWSEESMELLVDVCTAKGVETEFRAREKTDMRLL